MECRSKASYAQTVMLTLQIYNDSDQSYSCHSELEASDKDFEVLSLNVKGLLGRLGARGKTWLGKAFLPADALALTPLAAAHIPRSAPKPSTLPL